MTEEHDNQPKPTSLDEAHDALLRILTPEQVEALRLGHSEASWQHHHGLGTFIRNPWIRHGQLGRVFADINPGSIDGMSALTLESFVSKLRGRATRIFSFDEGPERGQPDRRRTNQLGHCEGAWPRSHSYRGQHIRRQLLALGIWRLRRRRTRVTGGSAKASVGWIGRTEISSHDTWLATFAICAENRAILPVLWRDP